MVRVIRIGLHGPLIVQEGHDSGQPNLDNPKRVVVLYSVPDWCELDVVPRLTFVCALLFPTGFHYERSDKRSTLWELSLGSRRDPRLIGPPGHQ